MQRLVYIILLTTFLTIFLFLPVAQTSIASTFGDSLTKTAENTGHIKTGINKSFELTIGEAIKLFLRFLGVIFMILMIYGGYVWMMARGNDQEVDKAKKIITNAMIGLVVVLAAYAITYFIMDNMVGDFPDAPASDEYMTPGDPYGNIDANDIPLF